MSLDQVEAKIRSRLTDLNGLGARVKFVVEGEGALLLDGKAFPPTLSREDGEADTTITMTEDNLMKLLDGQLNPTIAYTLGKLKVQGSMGYALKLSSILED
jgi:putative sterol carrier protein